VLKKREKKTVQRFFSPFTAFVCDEDQSSWCMLSLLLTEKYKNLTAVVKIHNMMNDDVPRLNKLMMEVLEKFLGF
jgi:hypothetical protein